jgi:uncharacterized membrane protein
MDLIRGYSLRHILYEQRGGYFVLPLLIMLAMGLLAFILPRFEATEPALQRWAEHLANLPPSDPQMAQILLGAIAGSCITVVSIVYSVLVIALTFASIQFSPRVLISFVKDLVSQTTLGLFIGTFAYCLILLPSIQSKSTAGVPTLSLLVALLLAAACLFDLLYFIQHIALSIQVNFIINRVWQETRQILLTQFGKPLKGFPAAEEPITLPSTGVSLAGIKSGYIQFVDEKKLIKLAVQANASIYVIRGVGQFNPAGAPLLNISPAIAASHTFRRKCLECFHMGPLRSMELDVEYGVLQLVDIALKAISPAVNDPSTAIACIDHLSALLLLAATLEPPIIRIYDSTSTVRLTRRQTSFPRLLEIAFDQIIAYGKSDMAVSLRLMRALYDVSGVTNYPPYLQAVRNHAQRVAKGVSTCFDAEVCVELLDRQSVIEKRSRTAI